MSKPQHGGGVDRLMAETGLERSQIIDFSASINPLGVPEGVQQALQAALARISDYPEPEAESLRQMLAAYHQLPIENLLPGSGSTELIYLLPRALRPRRALLVQPCFGEYAPALQQAGCRVDQVALDPEENFSFSVERLLAALHAETDLVLLANPGNPSGIGIAPQQLLTLAAQLGERALLIDEAFADFCPQRSLLGAVAARRNLYVLRSLTKFYAIPGLRAGYLAGPAAGIAKLAQLREPWTLSTLAIAAARACLAAERYRGATLETIPRLRDQFARGLEDLGLKVFAGEANYLLCRLPDAAPLADRVAACLRPQGLLIRNCADFMPLDNRYLRLAVMGEGANRRLLSALRRQLV